MKIINGGLVYDIYDTGEIEQRGDIEKADNVSFIYHDKNGVEHNLGSYKLIEVDAYDNGKKIKPDNYLPDTYIAQKSSAYNNTTIYYRKLNYKVKTIDISEHMVLMNDRYTYKFHYNNNNLEFSFYLSSTRKYAQPKCFASIIGAVIETGYMDIRITGFTSEDGTGSPSLTHPLGINVDISNMDTEMQNPTGNVKISGNNYSRERNRNLANALIKFGYHAIRTTDVELCKSNSSANWDYTDKQKPCRYLTGHKDHFHCERYQY